MREEISPPPWSFLVFGLLLREARVANLSPSGGLLPGTNGGLPFGQPANNTGLNGPGFVAFSNSKNTLFVSDTGNSQVR